MKTHTPGAFGRPENPDHYLNDDLKPHGKQLHSDWAIDDERAVDDLRDLGEQIWQTKDPTEQAEIHRKIERAVIRLSVANEVGRQANAIWRAENDADRAREKTRYAEQLTQAVAALKEQANGAPYYISHTDAVATGFRVGRQDIESAVLPPEPLRGSDERAAWAEETSKLLAYDDPRNPDKKSPVYELIKEAKRRTKAGEKPNYPEDPRSGQFYDAMRENIAVLIRQPLETWAKAGAGSYERLIHAAQLFKMKTG